MPIREKRENHAPQKFGTIYVISNCKKPYILNDLMHRTLLQDRKEERETEINKLYVITIYNNIFVLIYLYLVIYMYNNNI